MFASLLIVFGAISANAAADLWIRDDSNDLGNEPNNDSTVFYLSDDIWVRRQADPNYDPQPFPAASPTWTPLPHEGPCYRDPKTSSPNYIYVRVRNRGSTASAGTETLHVYWAKASTGLSWPGDWNDHLADPCATGTPRLYGYEVTKPRRNAATASSAVRNAYVAAIQAIDASPFLFPDARSYFDKQNDMHAALFGAGIHSSLRFLPWHREMMNRYEALLRESRPELTLLYWDWTTDPSPTILGPGGFFGAASGVVGAPFASFGISRNKGSGAPGAPGLAPAYQSGTLLPTANFAAFTGPSSFSSGIEHFLHDEAHCYIDGTMCTVNAARDPIFFMLHANCDRLWAMWQRRNSSNVDRWTPASAYDASQSAAAITSDLRPWDGTDGFSPWQNQIPGDPNGYEIHKTPTHHSIVFPPIYEDVLLKIPVLQPNEQCIIEIPFYPPPAVECGSFADPQHLCLLARIQPITTSPAEGANLWNNVKTHNNIAWRNVSVSDCNIGPFFKIAPGRLGAAGELIRNVRNEAMGVTLRFDETAGGFRSLFRFARIRLRMDETLFKAWEQGGRAGKGVEVVGDREVMIFSPGATLQNLRLEPRQLGRMDLALELNRDYPEPSGQVYALDVLQFDEKDREQPVGGQRYEFDFNTLRLLDRQGAWRFLDGGQVPQKNWASLQFDDSKWKTGEAPLGYDRPDVTTRTRPDPTGKTRVTYFRKEFEVADPSFYHSLGLHLIQDDGVVVHLNGEPILRLNMPDGAIGPETPALRSVKGAEAQAYRALRLDNFLGALRQGINVLAVELHAARDDRSGVGFDAELVGNPPSTPYQPPVIDIQSPARGTLVKLGTDVEVLADVVDADGDLTEVRILGDGKLIARAEKGPFTALFRQPGPGKHRITVEAEDRFGRRSRMESLFVVAANLVPEVEIASLGTRAYPTGAAVPVAANAVDRDGRVAKVEFFVRRHLRFNERHLSIGVDSNPPYETVAKGLPPGHYMVYATATDDVGAMGFSLPEHFTIGHFHEKPEININLAVFGKRRVVTLSWEPGTAALERAPTLKGPWETVADAARSYDYDPDEKQYYFRARANTDEHVHAE